MPNCTSAIPSPHSANPIQSNRSWRNSPSAGTTRKASAMPSSPNGTLTKKIQRQFQ